jgi:NADH-quinone oxidoreductase subunit J
MFSPIFYIFAAMMIAGGLMVVLMHNPVSSALAMVLSFIGLAGIFTGLNAYFVGILQILVYAGAIMVLFIFIIMLLDLKKEEQSHRKGTTLLVGIVLPIVFIIQLAGVLATQQESPTAPELNFKQAIEAGDFGKESIIVKRMEEQRLPDVHLIGRKLYTDYNFPLQVIAVLLLSATIGCVTLSKKSSK